MRKPTRRRQCKSVSRGWLQWEPVFRLRHQWKACLVGLAASVQEGLSARQLHQPIFANEILDDFSRLLSESRVEGEPVPTRLPLKHRAIGSRLAPGQQTPLPGDVCERLGSGVVCRAGPE